MRGFRRGLIRWITAPILAVALVTGGAVLWLRGESGGAFLANQISHAASSPGFKLTIDGLDNPLSSEIGVRGVAISDADGPWLRIDRIGVKWSPLALLGARADIVAIAINRVDILRRPLPSSEPAKPASKSGPLIPELPVDVRLGRLSVEHLTLAEAVAGASADFSLESSGALGRGVAALKLAARRLDAPGDITLDARMSANAKASVSLRVSEPAGGAVSRLAALPGLPAVDVTLEGAGDLEDFSATLKADAGERIGAEGVARLLRDGATRRATLELTGRVEPLLPSAIGALFTGPTRVSASAALPDAGGAHLERLSLTSSALLMEASGSFAADGALDGKGSIRPAPVTAGAAFKAKTLDASFTLGGTLSLPNASARLLVEDAVSPAGHFDHFGANLKASSTGLTSDPASRIDVALDLVGSEFAFADRALAEAIGENARATFRARMDAAGVADIGVAKLEANAGEASFSGRAGANTLAGKLQVFAPDLARLSRITGRDLRGDLKLAADLSGVPAEGHVEATLSGGIAGPGVGIAALDGLLGRRLAISGGARTLPGGGVGFDDMLLVGDNARLSVKGLATNTAANILVRVDIPEMKRADPRVTGRAGVDLAIRGNLRHPDATFNLAIDGATAAGRGVPRLSLRGEAKDITGALAATAMLEGVVDGKPARGQVAARRVEKALVIDGVDVAIGRATLKGALSIAETGLAAGRLTFSAADLDDLSALALRKLAGKLDADITLESLGGGQNIAIDARGSGLRSPEFSLDRLAAKFSGRDLLRRPALDGEATIENARVGNETITKARLAAKPSPGGAALELAIDARGFAIAGRGVLVDGDRQRLDIAALSAQRGAQRLALAGPASMLIGGDGAELKGLSIAIGAGRLDIDGRVGRTLDLTARARAIPLSVVALVDTSLALEGTLEAEARVEGSAAAPSGDWKARVSKLTAPQTRSNGLPPIDINANGRLSGGRTTVEAELVAGASSRIAVTGSAPWGEGALEIAVKGALDAALGNTMLAANGQTLKGRANIDLRLSGPASAPIYAGDVVIADGAFNDPLNGVGLSNIAAKLEARGRDLTVASFSAATKGGGPINLTGRVTLAPESGFPGALHITARNARLASSELVTSNADVDLDITGALAQAPRVNGKVTLLTMEIAVPDKLPASLKPLPGTIHIDARGFAKQMLDLERKQKAREVERAARKSPFDALLDVAIVAQNRIFLRGRGIDAEFGGDLRLNGTIQKPNVIGGFDLRRGRMQLLTQRLDINKGKLTFAGGLMPELDFSAEATAADITATIAVSGPATAPSFGFTSTPSLPQDEILSRILFAKASGSLSPFQAVQLATALAQFSGAGSGVDAFEKMRKALGVDSLDVSAAGANGPTVGASRYLTNNISVGVKTGTKPEQSSVNVGIDVTKGLRLQGETSMDGKTSVGIGVEVEY